MSLETEGGVDHLGGGRSLRSLLMPPPPRKKNGRHQEPSDLRGQRSRTKARVRGGVLGGDQDSVRVGFIVTTYCNQPPVTNTGGIILTPPLNDEI